MREFRIVGHAAVAEFGRAGDVATDVRGEHRRHAGNIFGRPHSAERDLGEQILEAFGIAP
jgi:hypothetical protein